MSLPQPPHTPLERTCYCKWPLSQASNLKGCFFYNLKCPCCAIIMFKNRVSTPENDKVKIKWLLLLSPYSYFFGNVTHWVSENDLMWYWIKQYNTNIKSHCTKKEKERKKKVKFMHLFSLNFLWSHLQLYVRSQLIWKSNPVWFGNLTQALNICRTYLQPILCHKLVPSIISLWYFLVIYTHTHTT